jgi:hypothetical protein
LQPATKRIWFSLYTPQVGEISAEQLTPGDRQRAVAQLRLLRLKYPKLEMPATVLEGYEKPPQSPAECTFARLTHCVSADLNKQITPCQFGGNPDCSQCGCMASAGLAAIARHQLVPGLRLGTIVDASAKVGGAAQWARRVFHRDGAQPGTSLPHPAISATPEGETPP